MDIYWGDLHNHCGITYGYGSLENALAAAREQLDFCAVIGHAMWPDIPQRTRENAFSIDYHREGFAKLRAHWPEIRATVAKAHVPREFVTFQGYEIHSRCDGDHHILSPDDRLPLIEADNPADLVRRLRDFPVIAVPHHIAYTPGYRGINWDAYAAENSPLVEIFSKHGCGLSDAADYPFYHTMGPRDSRSTALAGMNRGHRFGFAGSTDHHAGYPGSHGDGRIAVLARDLTRESIWEALLARRTYAVTGDKIYCRFTVNGEPFGGEVSSARVRDIALSVTACDQIDRVTVFKNGVPWRRESGLAAGLPAPPAAYKIRVETGWGDNKEGFAWQCEAEVDGGVLQAVETCFRGRDILAPTADIGADPDCNALNNHLLYASDKGAAWTCTTFANPTTRHPATAGVILEITGDASTRLRVKANATEETFTLAELTDGSRSWHLQPIVSEAVRVHRAIPDSAYRRSYAWTDNEPTDSTDVYFAEVRQQNRQYAWLSPVFVHPA